MESRRLDLQHGFINFIRQHQFSRLERDRHLTLRGASVINPKKRSLEPSSNCEKDFWLSEKKTENMIGMIITYKTFKVNMADVDLENYMTEARPYIQQALNDPSSLDSEDLKEVARVVVNRAWEDQNYYTTAANICNFIAQKEYEQQQGTASPQYAFHSSIVSVCKALYRDWQEMRKCELQYWMNYVQLLMELYRRLRFDANLQQRLSSLLLQALIHLAQPPCVLNFDEAELMTCILHDLGSDLELDNKVMMSQLMRQVRDAFLDPMADEETRTILLPIIEKQAGNWTLSECATKYYFGI